MNLINGEMEDKINLIGIAGQKQSGKNLIGEIIQYLTCPNNTLPFEAWRKTTTKSSKWEIKSFAYKLKQIVSLLTGVSVEDLEKEEIKNSSLNTEWNLAAIYRKEKLQNKFPSRKKAYEYYNHRLFVHREDTLNTIEIKNYRMSYREVLQYIGTDLLRNQFHENIWINALFADYKEYSVIKHTTIPEIQDIYNGEKVQSKSYWIITDVRFPNEADAIKERGGILLKKESNPNIERTDLHESETAMDNYKGFDETIPWIDSINDLIEVVKVILIKYKII